MAEIPMTKGEREDLQRLVRQREKALKSAAKQRSTELLADFENQMLAEYSFDQDETWAEATKLAEAEVAKAQARVAARCRELGIPDRFAPDLNLRWQHGGTYCTVESRKRDLRRMATTRIAALEQAALVRIELDSVTAQTATAGLTSEASLVFLAKLKPVEELMPALSFDEIAGRERPPIAEQLISPNALRQRRYRDEQKALRDADVTAEDNVVKLPPAEAS
jgi:hypothetical protein